MSIKAVLFDLDGTLLPMDQEKFVMTYLGLLAKRLAPKGYDAQKLMKVMWAGVGAMVKNDGSCTNEETFWKVFVEAFGEDGFIPKIENLKAAVSDKTKAILFNSPNNPTGAVYDAETLKGIGQLALENDFWLVSDEIYEALVYDGAEHFSVAALCPEGAP